MFLETEMVIATGAALIVIGWILISPGKWKPQAGRLTSALAFVGMCMIAVGMVTVVQGRNWLVSGATSLPARYRFLCPAGHKKRWPAPRAATYVR